MFKLNLKIAFRNLLRHKGYAAINIVGLAIGLASCLLLMMYTHYEWNFDRQFKNSPRLYQAMVNFYDEHGNVTRTIGQTQNILASTLRNQFPEVDVVARSTDAYPRLFTVGSKGLKLDTRYADPDLQKLFVYDCRQGNVELALRDPHAIVLTETAAKRLFGTVDALNKEVLFEGQVHLKVGAIIKDLPKNITYSFESLAPWVLYENLNQWPKEPKWGNHDYVTLIKLDDRTIVDQFNQKLKGLVKKNLATAKEDVFLYPLTRMHLYGNFENGKVSGGKIQQVTLFVAIAVGILILACINFMNLATSNAQHRTKEIGIKKTMGASRKALFAQFMIESLTLTLFSVIIGVIILEFSLPWFNNLLDIDIRLDYVDAVNWLMIVGLCLVAGLLAGCYPALYLSNLDVVLSLKKRLNFQKGYRLSFRQLSVIVQFSFSAFLVAATLTIYKQIQYIRDQPLGYETDGLVEMPHEGELYTKYDLLRSKLIENGAVIAVAQSSGSISKKNSSIRGLSWEGMPLQGGLIDFDQIFTTYNFIKTTGIKLIAGRDFDERMASDTAGLLLSKKAVSVMDLSNPIGQKIIFQGQQRNVIGVFEDIQWGDPTRIGAPMIIAFGNISDVITMKLNPAKSLQESISLIGTTVRELNPEFPLTINFIDQLNKDKLNNERILSALANLFGGLAIIISSLGLLGLSAFSVGQRFREISIRKILGASTEEIVMLLGFSFLKLIVIAIVITLPFAYYFLDQWLQTMEVRTSLNWWVFLLTAIFVLLVGVLTICWQTYRASTLKAVDGLKYE